MNTTGAKPWREDGCTTMSDWLVSRLNIARRTANDLIAIANRLNDQPELSEVMARAEVSLDQARAASQLPDIDPEEAASMSAAQLERRVRATRKVDRHEDTERPGHRSVRGW